MKVVQWRNRKHNTVTAHVVNEEAVKKTGVSRTLCGSTIPKDAEYKKGRGVALCAFCAQLQERRGGKEKKSRKRTKKS